MLPERWNSALYASAAAVRWAWFRFSVKSARYFPGVSVTGPEASSIVGKTTSAVDRAA